MTTQQTFAVYHAIDPLEMALPHPAHWHTDKERHYRHVTDVAASCEQVFALTNHIDYPWTRNPAVIWHAADRALRSTSIGDVMVDCYTQEAWLILTVGFHAL
jgi:hypothetical protein